MSKTPERELTDGEKFLLGAPPYPGPRRKALRIEVSRRTFEAVKANPSELKLLAKDANGNPVIERPHRPRTGTISESEVGTAEYERIRGESRGRPRPDLVEVSRFGEPLDQYWIERRDRHSGEVRYVPDDGSRNPFVMHAYDIFDVLREDD
jgi:hypothetical protein